MSNTPLPWRVEVFVPNPATLSLLWKKFDANRAQFSDELDSDPIHFVCWVSAPDALGFLIYGLNPEPAGFFLFTNIEPNRWAWSHIYVWDRHALSPRDLVRAAQIACGSVMSRFNLVAIRGMTPHHAPEARVFAERVGFVVNGSLPKAVQHGGQWEEAWISSLTDDAMAAIVAAGKDAKLVDAAWVVEHHGQAPDLQEAGATPAPAAN